MTTDTPEGAPSIHVEQIGDSREPVVVVDHFAFDPQALVEEAGRLRFERHGAFYPGVRAHASGAYFADLGPLLAKVVREVFGYRRELALVRSLYALTTTSSDQLTLAQRVPHFDDTDAGRIAVLHYLTHDDQGGTSFYRHRSTGFETVDASRHRLYLDVLAQDLDRYGPPDAAYIDDGAPIFERIARFAPRFNRALIYRSNLLHCADIGANTSLSADPRTGRLTLASFLAAR
jgi:hypothetical protein